MADLSFDRFVSNLGQFIKFGLVGGSGALVNIATSIVAAKCALNWWGATPHDAMFNLFGTQFHVRWFMLLSTIAFLVANTWNYQLNRVWTFRGVHARSWLRGFFPFLATGALAFAVSLTCMTLLMNPTTPIGLPDHIFDDSTGLRTKSYWALAISTFIAMPVNFIINNFWAFGKPKSAV